MTRCSTLIPTVISVFNQPLITAPSISTKTTPTFSTSQQQTQAGIKALSNSQSASQILTTLGHLPTSTQPMQTVNTESTKPYRSPLTSRDCHGRRTGGTPYLTLETGTSDREILYSGGSGSSTLSFLYTVTAGDQSDDLDVYSTTALSSNGGTIRDSAGNDADLTLIAPGNNNSLSSNKEVIVDGIAPILSSPPPINVNENASNNLELHDFDDLSGGDTDETGDALTYSIQSGNSDNIFGIDANTGKLIIENNSLLDYSNAATHSLIIQASDGSNTASTTATIYVNDINNNPVAVNDSINLNENATAEQTSAVNGVLSNDFDSDGDSITLESFRTGIESGSGSFGILGSAREGNYGSLTLSGDGTFSYIADLAAADALAEGVTATDAFTYSVSDGKGGDTGEIIFTITGVNDAPYIVDAIGKKKYTEGQGATIIIDGSLTVKDLDDSTIESATVTISTGYEPTEDVLGFSNTSEISGSWNAASGQLSLSGTASRSAYAAALATVTYHNSDDANPVLGHRTVSWQINDGSAASNTALSIIDVGGINDSPESQNDAGSVDAGSSLNILAGSGLLINDSDPESDDLTISDVRTGSESQSGTDGSIGTALTGDYGQLTVNADGSYAYSANQAAADALAEGATALDVFTYTLSDGVDNDLGELTITITGTNNAPSGSDDSKQVNENELININAISGVLINDTDVDGDSLTITAVQKTSQTRLFSTTLAPTSGAYGLLTLNSNGSYSYDANQSATDALNEGDLALDLFTYTLSDNKTTSLANLEIIVTGVNDLPALTTPPQATISEVEGSNETESSGLTGTFSATDADSDAHFEYGILGGSAVDHGSRLTGTYGTLEIDAFTGEYVYTPNESSIEALNDGDLVSDQFRICVSDTMALDNADFEVLIRGASENPSAEPTPNPTPEPSPAPTPTPTPSAEPISAPNLEVSAPPEGANVDCLISRATTNRGLNIIGSPCQDIIKGQKNDDVLLGRSGDDHLTGKPGKDLLRGGQGDDTLRGGKGADKLTGHKGHDLLIGQQGNDLIRGRSGDDTIKGGQGDDTIKGGRGADLIHLSHGQDQILDFKPRQGDRLIAKNLFSFEATELDGNLILSDIENNTQITLHNISLITALAAQPELFS